jgi:hypothetical protein
VEARARGRFMPSEKLAREIEGLPLTLDNTRPTHLVVLPHYAYYFGLVSLNPPDQFGLALVFFAMFIVGSYWWMVFGPGRGL